MATLERLTEIGMELAEVLRRRVKAAAETGVEIDTPSLDTSAMALEYSRLSRAVRQTLALEARLDQDRAALAVRVKAERTSALEAASRHRDESIEYTANCVTEAVEELADAMATRDPEDDRPERLLEVMSERLEDPREADDIADLPVSVLIERICAAVGVAPDWSLWEREDWAVAEWKAAMPGSPYAPGPDDCDAPGRQTAIPSDPGRAFIREHGPP